jgi:hypothetical protein
MFADHGFILETVKSAKQFFDTLFRQESKSRPYKYIGVGEFSGTEQDKAK